MIARFSAGGWIAVLQILVLVPGDLVADDPTSGDYWVFFIDKLSPDQSRIAWHQGLAEEDVADLPVNIDYISQVQATGAELRIRSRWFNAVTVRATPGERVTIEQLECVRRVLPVGKSRRSPDPPVLPASAKAMQEDPSLEQRSQIGVEALHEMGFRGEGIRIAVLDNGFHYSDHKAFEYLRQTGRVVAERDFVNDDDVVFDELDQPVTADETVSLQNIHGAQVLSILAADDPGRLVGTAPEAEYLLAKTEDNGSELPIEEDRWIAGLEWADSLGADIVNSSLGYTEWDGGEGYTYADLDGETALTTRAAAMAAARGMILVVAAGNEGNQAWRYVTAPADAAGVIAVGAVDAAQRIASFSSVGPTADGRIKPDLVAPGVQIVVADIRGGDYERRNGTSFAAPLVTGACALLLQVRSSWEAEDVFNALRNSATDLGAAEADTVYGWGLVNALRASALDGELPDVSLADDPFPNPSLGNEVNFPVDMARRDRVALGIYDLSGSIVHEFETQMVEGANQRLRWTVPDQMANGVYFYQVSASDFVRSGKFALVR